MLLYLVSCMEENPHDKYKKSIKRNRKAGLLRPLRSRWVSLGPRPGCRKDRWTASCTLGLKLTPAQPQRPRGLERGDLPRPDASISLLKGGGDKVPQEVLGGASGD